MLLDEVGHYLEAQGLGVVKTAANNPATWAIYKGGVPAEAVDEIIVLSEFFGKSPINEMGSTVGACVAEQPALNVTVRSASYVNARIKAEAIWKKLHRLGNVSLGSPAVRYLLIMAGRQPFPVGRDRDSESWLIGCDYDVTKELS